MIGDLNNVRFSGYIILAVAVFIIFGGIKRLEFKLPLRYVERARAEVCLAPGDPLPHGGAALAPELGACSKLDGGMGIVSLSTSPKSRS